MTWAAEWLSDSGQGLRPGDTSATAPVACKLLNADGSGVSSGGVAGGRSTTAGLPRLPQARRTCCTCRASGAPPAVSASALPRPRAQQIAGWDF